MPHIECEFPEYIIPIGGSKLCNLNLYTYFNTFDTSGSDVDLFDVMTPNGSTVGDTINSGNFGILPEFMVGTFENGYGHKEQYSSINGGIVATTQSQNPSNNPLSWFRSNPIMYDLFISPSFDGNFMRFDYTTIMLSELSNKFYGLKISERGIQYNNASAPDGSGIKTFYTPLQPYNDGKTDSSPGVFEQNAGLLEQYILGSYGSRDTRDSLLTKNKYTSDDMFFGGTPDIPQIHQVADAVPLNNSYLSLAWVMTGPRKPKSNTNYFVNQLNLSDFEGPSTPDEFGPNMGIQEASYGGVKRQYESNEAWEPGVVSAAQTGILSYTQKLVETSLHGDNSVGEAMRQDTKYIRTKNGVISRGSGVENFNKTTEPFARSWKRPSNLLSPEMGNDKPESYSRYDSLLRHQGLLRTSTGDTFSMRGGWSNGGSVIGDVGEPHIAQSSKDDVKNFMFSLENLAWKDYAESNLAKHERGPNGGRLMWFPPYIESWTENSSANWNQTDIIGRVEPIYTYKNSHRQVNLNFIMVTDYPQVLDNMDFTNDSEMEAAQFFAGVDFNDINLVTKIVAGKAPTFPDPEGYERALNKIRRVPPKSLISVSSVPSETGPADTVPLEVYHFSGCSKTDESCGECGSRFYEQFNAVQGGSFEIYKNGLDEEVPGDSLKMDKLGEFLASESGKQYKVVLTYGTAPIVDISEDAQKIVAEDTKSCGVVRCDLVKDTIVGRIKKYELGDSSVTPVIGSLKEGYLETWYDEDSPLDGRWEIKEGSITSSEMLLREVSVDGEMGKIIPVLPIMISIVPNPSLNSKESIEKSNKDYRDSILDAHNNYVETHLRIPDGDYFEKLKEDDMFAYQGYKDKIKNFQPSFHSVHPCGFNSRMTFLNQILRPGPSIQGTAGPKNMAFGRPPICVLRLGDFYHCKVVINNVDFSYEQPFWDMNPEGIGAQPWLVRVSMQMFVVGGMSLAGPLSQLQNATSFNYYANTELCEPDRANPKKYFDYFDGEKTADADELIYESSTERILREVEDDISGVSSTNSTIIEEEIWSGYLATNEYVNIHHGDNGFFDPNKKLSYAETTLSRVSPDGVSPSVYMIEVEMTPMKVNLKTSDGGDKEWNLGGETFKSTVFIDNEGCVGGKTVGCVILKEELVKVFNKVKDFGIQRYDTIKSGTPINNWNEDPSHTDAVKCEVRTTGVMDVSGEIYNIPSGLEGSLESGTREGGMDGSWYSK